MTRAISAVRKTRDRFMDAKNQGKQQDQTDWLFASIQTLGKRHHLRRLRRIISITS